MSRILKIAAALAVAASLGACAVVPPQVAYTGPSVGIVVGPTGLPESGGGGGDESDPLYDEAVKIVTESRRASISGVQRRLKIGYNRAARLIEAMEAAGVVSPPEHNGDRQVLAPPPPR